MTLLKQCFCYSLRQGSFLIGSYSLIVYCLAFAVELWWIIEALLILPAPAYTLCALYFFNFVMAAILLFGLLIRQRKYLMGWSLMTVLSFFPECGMVLFMSLYYWPTHKYEYGVIELVYWSLRAIFNIFGALCVISLYLCWRDEELILGRLHDLTLASVESGSTGGGLILTHHNNSSNGTLKRPQHLFRQQQQQQQQQLPHSISYISNNNNNTSSRRSKRRHNNHNNNNNNNNRSSRTPTNFAYRNYGYLDSFGPQPLQKSRDFLRSHKNSVHDLQNSRGFRGSFHQPTTLTRHNRQKNFHLTQQLPSRSVSTAAIFTYHQNNNNKLNNQRQSSNSMMNNVNFNSHSVNANVNQQQQQQQQLRERAQAHANLSSTTLRKNEFNPAIIFDPSFRYKSRVSDWGIAGIGIDPYFGGGGYPKHTLAPLQRTHSLWHVSNDEYWARPPPSRPVSMGYVNHAYNNEFGPQNFNAYDSNGESYLGGGAGGGGGGFNSLQKQDSSSYWNNHGKGFKGSAHGNKNWLTVPSSGRIAMGRKATSVDGLNQLHQQRYYGQNILANSNQFMMKSNQLKNQNIWTRSSSDEEYDDDDGGIFHNYQRDVAL